MVVVHPPLDRGLTADEAERRAAAGLFGDDAASLQAAFRRIGDLWDESIARARTLDPALLNERVDGEWSYLETIRHLVFGIDAWITGILQGKPRDFHALGMPPAHAGDPSGMGLSLDAKPSLDEVLAVWEQRRAMASEAFASATDEHLSDAVAGADGQYTVVAALQVIVHEEYAHYTFATRDLDRLTGVGSTA